MRDGRRRNAESDLAAGLSIDQPTVVANDGWFVHVGCVNSTDVQADASVDWRSVLDFDTQRRPQVTAAGDDFFDEREGEGVVHVVHDVEVGETNGPRRESELSRRRGECEAR